MLKDQLKKTIEIKISTVVAISVILHAADTAVLAAALSEMTGGMPDYFDDEFAVIDVGPLGAQAGAIEWGELVGLLKRHSLNPVAVRNAPDGVEAAAAGHGLSVDVVAKPRQDARQAEPVLEHGAEAGVEAEVEAMVAQSPAVEAHAGAAQAPEVEAQATPAPKLETKAEAEATAAPKQEAKATATPPHADAAPALPTMFVDTPVRAGQRIYARGGDLVIMAAVNHGAEVVADGSIHIYGALRGRAIAGNSGNPDARIFALFMEPELVSINGLYRTFEDGFPRGAVPQPTQVRLSGEKIELLPLPPVSRI